MQIGFLNNRLYSAMTDYPLERVFFNVFITQTSGPLTLRICRAATDCKTLPDVIDRRFDARSPAEVTRFNFVTFTSCQTEQHHHSFLTIDL